MRRLCWIVLCALLVSAHTWRPGDEIAVYAYCATVRDAKIVIALLESGQAAESAKFFHSQKSTCYVLRNGVKAILVRPHSEDRDTGKSGIARIWEVKPPEGANSTMEIFIILRHDKGPHQPPQDV